jgi:hypothetical protein
MYSELLILRVDYSICSYYVIPFVLRSIDRAFINSIVRIQITTFFHIMTNPNGSIIPKIPLWR